MIQTAIPRNLKLRPNAHGRPTRLGNDDALDNAVHVSLYYKHTLLVFKQTGRSRRRVTWKSIAH